MKIAGFDVQYIGHVCFLFTSPGGAVVLTDPFFAEGFPWQGHIEHYVSRPGVRPEDITRCDAIFVSHIHGDHCDLPTLKTVVEQSGATVWAPADVIEALRAVGVPQEWLQPLTEGMALRAGDVSAMAFAGYDNSLDEQGRANKFSLLLEYDGGRIFYSGDCHEPPPGIVGQKVDAIFAWPYSDDAMLAALGRAISAREYVLMHGDRFVPGDFLCNLSYEDEKPRVERLIPGITAVIPERVRRLSWRRDA